MEAIMSNPSQWVLVKRFAELIGYGENAVRHKTKNGTRMRSGFMAHEMRDSRERHLQGSEA